MRFVVLHHTGTDRPHFDLMFETAPDAPLATWRCENWPIVQPQKLMKIGDHRREYLEFEGELSQNRGHVQRIASGSCAIDRHDDDSCWSIRFSDALIAPLNMRHVSDDHWLAVPSCGG